MKKGISLISLIITIIVVIILAAIAIFLGFGAIKHAQLAKFTSGFADYEAAIQNQYLLKKQEYALVGNVKSDEQIFAELAGGTSGDIPAEIASQIGEGKAYVITNTILGYAPDKFGTAYISTEGIVYLDPADAYVYETEDGTIKKYASASIIIGGEGGGEVTPPVDVDKQNIIEKLKVGDYVKYWAKPGENSEEITVTSDRTGHNKSVTFSNADWQYWRVWKNNGDGTVELMMRGTAGQKLVLQGTLGYENGPEILQEIYDLSGVSARSLTKDEFIEKVTGEDEDTYKDILKEDALSPFWLKEQTNGDSMYIVAGTLPYQVQAKSLAPDGKFGYYVRFIITVGEGLKIENATNENGGTSSSTAWNLIAK